jgi:hypothetical protein
MKKSVTFITLVAWVFLAALAGADALPTATPEEVGLSSQKLARVTEVVKAEIATTDVTPLRRIRSGRNLARGARPEAGQRQRGSPAAEWLPVDNAAGLPA